MNDETDLRTPAERVDDLPAILDAMDRAVRAALRRHKQAGNPVAIWRDGKAIWLPPDEIPVDEEDSAAEEPGVIPGPGAGASAR